MPQHVPRNSNNELRGWLASSSVMLAVAAVLRLPFLFATLLRPGFSWHWGGEMFSIANAIVGGQGFSSPYGEPTGPTAQQAPVFPYLVAMFARLTGSMDGAAIAVLLLNLACSTVVCLVLVDLGRRVRPGAGLLFGWTWALWPVLGFSDSRYLWHTGLYTLAFTALLAWLLRRVERRASLWPWALAAGATLLLDPAHVIVVAVLLAAFAARGLIAVRSGLLALGVMLAVLTPWVARNIVVLDLPVLRSNLAYEIYRGVSTDPSDAHGIELRNPGRNSEELRRYAALGEREYMAMQGDSLRAFAREAPGVIARRVATRAVTFWIGNHEVVANPWPVGTPIKHLLFAVPVVLALVGLLHLVRSGDVTTATMCVAVLVVFPLPYYVALTLPRYRAPIEPVLALLVAYALTTSARGVASEDKIEA